MKDTIAAIATPPGRGGVGVIRVSGPKCAEICLAITGVTPQIRSAHYAKFISADANEIDAGLAILFKAPNSFTGEDVLELQGHGGPVVLDMVLRRVIELGARMARAGEFSERAFLNNKIDLVQAEAVAQLISASTEQAASAAMRSLQGEFSNKISALVEELIRLRLYVEAAIDFPAEEIDFLADDKILNAVDNILQQINAITNQARQGILLEEGVNLVIAGRPNAGKSTLLNKLTGQDTAIVTPIAGTTRDLVKAQINLDGVPLNIIDTAGLRVTDDVVEQAGIARTWQALDKADLILLVIDASVEQETNPWILYPELLANKNPTSKVLAVYNKIDQTAVAAKILQADKYSGVYLSANTGVGVDLLRAQIKLAIGVDHDTSSAGVFSARRRHIDALLRAEQHVTVGKQQLEINRAGELLAEELKQAQLALSEITGAFTSDDLLGRIFSAFCIGK